MPIGTAWPLHKPGTYVATVGYEIPRTVVAPVDACAAIPALARAQFELKAAGGGSDDVKRGYLELAGLKPKTQE